MGYVRSLSRITILLQINKQLGATIVDSLSTMVRPWLLLQPYSTNAHRTYSAYHGLGCACNDTRWMSFSWWQYQDLFAEAVNFSSKIDFSVSHTPEEVRYVYWTQGIRLSYTLFSVFETTIRYLAGLLSAYELTNNQYPALLQKAQQVADKLAFAWNSASSG